jgi:hypothetical protein
MIPHLILGVSIFKCLYAQCEKITKNLSSYSYTCSTCSTNI